MSRTLSHVRYKHWNIKRLDPYWGYSDDQYEKVSKHARKLKPGATQGWVPYMQAVGKELYDLRFHAGCKRMPQLIHRRRYDIGYSRTWGHYGGAAKGIAHEQRCLTRGEERAYGQDIKKLHRAGEAFDDVLEPEGRTRHRAVWDAC